MHAHTCAQVSVHARAGRRSLYAHACADTCRHMHVHAHGGVGASACAPMRPQSQPQTSIIDPNLTPKRSLGGWLWAIRRLGGWIGGSHVCTCVTCTLKTMISTWLCTHRHTLTWGPEPTAPHITSPSEAWWVIWGVLSSEPHGVSDCGCTVKWISCRCRATIS